MYEEFYGFKNTPFRLSPDPAFFFGSSGHQRALAYLRYGLNQKEGFIVITGAPGTGKTTLARALLQEIGQDKIIIAELSTTRLEAEDVLRMVAASFGLEYENIPKATLLKRLESFCISRTRAGYHILLLVDEAQNLPYNSLEELRMLSNFYLGKNALLQIFLLGQEQFRNSLYGSDLEQLRQRVVASSHLDPLSQGETREYIEHRLRYAGWLNNPQISDRAFVRIFSLTKGVPRRINTFCERLLLYGALEELKTIKDDAVKTIANELMCEVSAKGVKLSDIEPGVPDIIKQTEAHDMDNISPEAIDSDILNHFSDDISENIIETDDVVTEIATEKENESVSAAKSSNSSNVENKEEITPAVESESTEEVDSVLEDTTQIDDLEDDKKPEKLKSSSKNKKALTKKQKKPMRTLRIVGGGSSTSALENQNNSHPETESPLVDTKPVWWDLVALAVTYYREPEQNIDVTSSKSTILPGIGDCFKIAIGKMVVPIYLKTGILSGIADEEIREAIRFYVKGSLLSNTADYYRRLGVEMEASFEQIRTHYKYLFRLFQPDKEKSAADWDETYTRRINQAYGTLRSTEKRKDYDEFLTALNKRNKNLAQRIENAEVVLNLNVDEDADKDTPSLASRMDEKLNPFINENNTESGKRGTPWLIGSVLVLVIAIGAGYFLLQEEDKAMLAPFDGEPEIATQSIEKLQLSTFEKREKVVAVKTDAKKAPIKQAVSSTKTKPDTKPIVKSKPVKKNDIVLLKQESSVKKPVKATPIKKKVQVAKKAPSTVAKSVKKVAVVQQQKKLKMKQPVAAERSTVAKTKNSAAPLSDVNDVLSAPATALKTPVTATVESVVAASSAIKPPLVNNASSKQIKKPQLLTQEKLREFITEFSLAYEEGDLNAFMTFFTDDASTNDAANKFAVKQNYRKLFSSTDMRVIDLGNLKWKITKRKAVGKGDFVLTVLGSGGGKLKKFEGLIKLELVPVNGQIKLRGMFHAYGSDN